MGITLSFKMVFLIIGILAIIQSVFGVGILLFGTPIFLFMGYEFSEILLYLLPASASLSWIQVFELRKTKHLKLKKFELMRLVLPYVVIGLIFSITYGLTSLMTFLVFLMLILTFFMRQFSQTKNVFDHFFRNHLKFSLGIMGLVHGISNMGGSLLTPIMSSIEPSKKRSLALISFCYALMASFQLLFVAFNSGFDLRLDYLLSVPLVILIKQTIGNSLLELTKERIYQNLINVFIFLNAIVVAVKLF